MKLIPKKITLKDDTENDIEKNNIDTNIFLERIKDYLDKANHLINNKMVDLSSIELYESLRMIFDISFNKQDYLDILSLAYHMNYTKYVTIYTNMYDNDGRNIVYYAVATQKSNCFDNETLDLNRLRKLTNSNELLVLETKYVQDKCPNKKEKYEPHQYISVDVENKEISEDSQLFLYAIEYLKNNIIIKDILYDLKLYIDEVIYQIRCITGLMFSKDERLSKIGKKYKKAYDEATNKGLLPKKEKVVVHHHKKVKRTK